MIKYSDLEQLIENDRREMINNAPVVHSSEIYNMINLRIVGRSEGYIHLHGDYITMNISWPTFIKIEYEGTQEEFEDILKLSHM